MKHLKRITMGCGIAAIAFLSCAWVGRQIGGISSNARAADQQSFPPQFTLQRGSETALVPAGTRINIRLKEPTGPEKHSAGDRFTASLYGPLIVGSKFLAPSRCKIIGQWTQMDEAGRSIGGARWTLVLRKLIVNGKEYDLDTEPLELAAVTSNEKEVAVIAASAASGAVNRVDVGGALTTGHMTATKRVPEADKPEARLTFNLSSPLELPVIRTMGRMEK